MRRFLNPDRERMIDERVHSEIGRRALKLKFINGMSLLDISEEVGMVYSTFTDNYYNKWLPELFFDFTTSDDGKDFYNDLMDKKGNKRLLKRLMEMITNP